MSAARESDSASPELREIAAMLALGGENEACVIKRERLDALHALGRRLFAAGEFLDAVAVFTRLCLHDHSDCRFWMGLGGSLQGAGNLEKAIDAYGMAGLCGALDDPEPFYRVALCHLELKHAEAARTLLEAIAQTGKNDSAAQAALRKKAANLRATLAANAGDVP
ncbi:MAG: hypothetical protein LBF93_03130 [Zoogloeaceae bacterium]|jgi:type III secretion system low calcium response chaperone LcrH/SycD|nr:hypothetical protein [Zoogloeaceae bacterium]